MILNEGELDGVRILWPETVRMMRTNQVELRYPAEGFGWGMGFQIRTEPSSGDTGRLGSIGWNGGTGTRFEIDPESGMIAIVFVPTWPGTPGVSDVRREFIAKARAAVRP